MKTQSLAFYLLFLFSFFKGVKDHCKINYSNLSLKYSFKQMIKYIEKRRNW